MIAFILAALVMVAGCSSAQPHQHSATIRDPSDQPVAIARFGRLTTPGAPGTIVGYVRGWPSGDNDSAPILTYVVDFQIVKIPQIDGSLFKLEDVFEAQGVRRVYFHPNGARLAFSDPSRFVNGDPVAIDKVRLTFDFPESGQIYLKLLANRVSSQPFDYLGHTTTAEWEGDGATSMFGRFSPPYGGFLLTAGT
jgi:hypothetical protein